MVGLITPSIGLMVNIEPTNIAPVLPALTNASICLVANNLKPTEILESFFCEMAFVGCSPIPITSVV